MLKKIVLICICLLALAAGSIAWLVHLVQRDLPPALAQTRPQDIPYLRQQVAQNRGRILAVVTSTATMGASGKKTGYELTELSRAYYVFSANGFEVEIASPAGGLPPVVIDDEDMGPMDYAFLNDPQAQSRLADTIAAPDIDPQRYRAVYFVGGKGAMWDFPDNPHLQGLLRSFARDGKVIAAVCHGPAALVNVRLDDGSYLLSDRQVSGFSNEEELFLIADARQVFPFLLEDRMRERGATVMVGPAYLEQVSRDGALLTGQNPWSVWSLVEQVVEELGYTPVPRELTPDEHSVDVLSVYEHSGYTTARARLDSLQAESAAPANHVLIAMHAVIAAMQWELLRAADLLGLASAARPAGT